MLDDLDRQLLHALQVDGRAAFSHIASVLGTSDRTIARRYSRLRSSGVVRVVVVPNGQALGYVDWMVRIRCSPDVADRLAVALSRRDDTSWVSLISGGTEITCITQTRGRVGESELLLEKLPQMPRVMAVTAHCLLRAVAGTSGWPGRTAALTPMQIAALQLPLLEQDEPGGDQQLTDADLQLLPLLAKDGRASQLSLAAATGWSESTVRRRLEELRRANLVHFVVDIDPIHFGFNTEAMLWLTVAPADLAEVTTALSEHQEISFAAATTGPSNIVAYVVCRNTGALYDYLAGRIGSLPGVLRAETAPILRRTKGAGAILTPVITHG